MAETRKILGLSDDVGISATCVRVPVVTGHSESVNVQTERDLAPEKCRELLSEFPGLVVLDEASSRLDPGTERLLDQAVSQLLRGRTGIIIAHRLETVERVDKIMVLADGRIVEYGPREALAGDVSSRYYSLLEISADHAPEFSLDERMEGLRE